MRKKNQRIVVTARGKTQSLREWAAETGIPYATLYQRFMAGWSEKELLIPTREARRQEIEDFLSQPVAQVAVAPVTPVTSKKPTADTQLDSAAKALAEADSHYHDLADYRRQAAVVLDAAYVARGVDAPPIFAVVVSALIAVASTVVVVLLLRL